MPNPTDSLRDDSTIKIMSSSDVICTGIFSTISKVEAVGRQRHPSQQPWTPKLHKMTGLPLIASTEARQ